MYVVIAIFSLFIAFCPFAHSMHKLTCVPTKKIIFLNRAMSQKPVFSLLESIRRQGNRHVNANFFNSEINIKDILISIKHDIYESGKYPHVDPTPGNPGYCQLVACFLDGQINALNALDLEHCDEEDTRPLLPLVTAAILQEPYCPKKYEDLSPKLIIQKLSSLGLLKKEIVEDYLKYIELLKKENDSLSENEKANLTALKKKEHLSNKKAEMLLEATQESFMDALFCVTKTSKDTAREESMKVALDFIHKSDPLIYLRYYDGTPDRANIFSSVGIPYFGNLYKRSRDDSEKWIKLSSTEIAKLLHENDRTNIIQIHLEFQDMLSGYFIELLKEKPEIKKSLLRNKQSGRINGVNDFFGFGDSVFSLRDFVLRGLGAIN